MTLLLALFLACGDKEETTEDTSAVEPSTEPVEEDTATGTVENSSYPSNEQLGVCYENEILHLEAS